MTIRRVLLATRENEPAEVLMVPWLPQHDADAFCFPAALQMVLEYYGNYYNDPRARALTPRLRHEEIVKLCGSSRENGTRIGDDLAARLTSELSLPVTLVRGFTFDGLMDRMKRGWPTILVYDGRYLLSDVAGPAHAGVYIGQARNGDPILNNPWVGSLVPFDRPKFEVAWENKRHRAFLVNPPAQQKIQEDT